MAKAKGIQKEQNAVTIRLTDEQETMIREILVLKPDMKLNKTSVFNEALDYYYKQLKRA